MPSRARFRRHRGPYREGERLGRRPLSFADGDRQRPRQPLGSGEERILFAGPPTAFEKLKKLKERADEIKEYYELAKKLIDPETRPEALFDKLFDLAISRIQKLFGKGVMNHPFFKFHETHFKVLKQALKDVGTLDAAEHALDAAKTMVERMHAESADIHKAGRRLQKGVEHLGHDRKHAIELAIYNKVARKSYDLLGKGYVAGHDSKTNLVSWRTYLQGLEKEITAHSITRNELQAEIEHLETDIIPVLMRHIEPECERASQISRELAGRFALLSASLMAVNRYLKVYEAKLKKLEKSSAIGAIMADNKRKKEQLRFKSLRPATVQVRKNAKETLLSGGREVKRWTLFDRKCRSGDILLFDPHHKLRWPWDVASVHTLDEDDEE